MSEVKAVIFDFDGIIVDSESSHWKCFNKILQEENIPTLSWEQYLKIAISMGDNDFFRWALEQNGREVSCGSVNDLATRKLQHFNQELPSLRPYPGVVDLITNLAIDRALAIGTSALREEVEFFLKRYGILDRFEAIVSAEDFDRPKPAPDCFLKALSLINSTRSEPILPDECLVIEDNPDGVKAAKDSGMQCVAVTNTHSRDHLVKVDAIISSLENFDIYNELVI
jgi:beta-phosphoglucomutase